METFKKLIARRDVLIGCAIWLTAGFVAAGIQFDLNKSEWAYWVGSIGTVGTLIGTIWLATSQTRRIHREETLRANLHATAFTFRLLEINRVVVDASEDLFKAVESSGDLAPFVSSLNGLSSMDMWTVDQLIPLAPLRENAAGTLAVAGAMIEDIVRQLKTTVSGTNSCDLPENLTALAVEIAGKLEAISASLLKIAALCKDAGVHVAEGQR